jgi:CRISPR/Cas system CSM-associated protein Csm5 (group 7 of RAMP superfamily)
MEEKGKTMEEKGKEIYKTMEEKGKEIYKTMEEKGIFGGIDPSMMTEDVLKLIRFSFDVAFDNVVKVQDFNVKILKDMLEKSKDVQADTVKVVSEFVESAKKGRDEYKKMITEGLDKVGEMITKTVPKK